ncbi:MAG: hypothetical protein IJH87_03390, partial [Atopobiaceae bacterium]|nr:hypothetical protein [Atopobiaceae bacterium]
MAHERIVVDAGTGYPLPGLLELPDDLSAPVPAVVMVQGSGASNMDEQVMKLTPFKDLAEGLRERGVASIRFDKRTFARSFSQALKLRKLKPTVWDESIEDALFAIGLAKSDS